MYVCVCVNRNRKYFIITLMGVPKCYNFSFHVFTIAVNTLFQFFACD